MVRQVLFEIKVLMVLVFFLMTLPVVVAERESPKLGYQLAAVSEPRSAPNFTLLDMDDVQLSLEQYRGKVVLLNFWASWCPPCRREMPSMERLHLSLKGEDFAVLAVNQMEDADHVFAYTGELEVDPTFTILFDKDSKVSHSFGVKGLPTTYLIDKQGRIRFRAIGGREFDHPEVVKKIKQLMKE